MGNKIAAQDEKLEHFVNATKLHAAHFKSANRKLTKIAAPWRTFRSRLGALYPNHGLLEANIVCCCHHLIIMPHTRPWSTAPRCLHSHCQKTRNVATQSIHSSDLFLVETSYIYRPEENTFVLFSTSIWSQSTT
jgi:hypothetical protein